MVVIISALPGRHLLRKGKLHVNALLHRAYGAVYARFAVHRDLACGGGREEAPLQLPRVARTALFHAGYLYRHNLALQKPQRFAGVGIVDRVPQPCKCAGGSCL